MESKFNIFLSKQVLTEKVLPISILFNSAKRQLHFIEIMDSNKLCFFTNEDASYAKLCFAILLKANDFGHKFYDKIVKHVRNFKDNGEILIGGNFIMSDVGIWNGGGTLQSDYSDNMILIEYSSRIRYPDLIMLMLKEKLLKEVRYVALKFEQQIMDARNFSYN